MARVTSIIREDAQWIVAHMGESLAGLGGTTFLVTGAGGFLGAFILDVIAAFNNTSRTPCRVIALDNFLSGLPERIAHLEGRPGFQFIQQDLTRLWVPDEPVHWILHAASIASPTFYRRFPLETIDVNVYGTRQMLELTKSHAVRSLVYMSTSEIYGDPSPDAIPTPEDYRGLVSCTGPRACYDESKRLGETLCSTYHALHGSPVKTIRPFNVYGPGQRLDDNRIIPDLLNAAIRCEPIRLLSDGKATRSFCYLRDAAWGILSALVSGADGEAYNLGNDAEEVTMREVAEIFIDVAADPRLELRFERSEDPHYLTDNPQRRCPDLRKLKKVAGWSPTVRLREGLSRTLASYQEEPQG